MRRLRMLAAVLAMVVLTACGGDGPSGTQIFLQKVNDLRVEYGTTGTIVQDKTLNRRVSAILSTKYQKVLDGTMNGAEWNRYRYNEVIGTTVKTEHGNVRITYIDVYKIAPVRFMNGNYDLNTSLNEYARNTLGLLPAGYVGLTTVLNGGDVHVIALFGTPC